MSKGGDKVNGVALGAVGVGVVFIYAGVKGISIAAVVRDLITGKSPASETQTTAVTAGAIAGGSPSSGGTASAPTNASESAFWTSVLGAMGAPANSANINSLTAWFHMEEPGWPPPFSNNPLNSTLPEAGSTAGGSQGNIQNYPNALVGVQATAATLTGGNYPQIVAALKAGKGLCGGGFADEFLTWSGKGYSSVC